MFSKATVTVSLSVSKFTTKPGRVEWKYGKFKSHKALCHYSYSAIIPRYGKSWLISRVLKKLLLKFFASVLMAFMEEQIFTDPNCTILEVLPNKQGIFICHIHYTLIHQIYESEE